MAFDFKTTNKSSQQSRVTSELAMQEFGSIDLSGNQSDWATRTMQTKVRDGAPYQPQLTLTGTSASNQRATTYSIETHITNIRLYVP